MAETLQLKNPLPVGSAGKKSVGHWGIWMLITTEGSLFGYLLMCYYYLYFQTELTWPPEGPPELLMPGINTGILLSSSVFVWGAERCVKRGRHIWSLILMAVAIVLGAIFVGIQFVEWSHKSYGLTTNLYGSLYFTITGFHMAHVTVGLVILSFLLLWMSRGYFDEKRHSAITIGGLYWHFVDAVWLFIFSSLYLFPHVMVP